LFDPFTENRGWTEGGSADSTLDGEDWIDGLGDRYFRIQHVDATDRTTDSMGATVIASDDVREKLSIVLGGDVNHSVCVELFNGGIASPTFALTYTTDNLNFTRIAMADAAPLSPGELSMTLDSQLPTLGAATTWPSDQASLTTTLPIAILPRYTAISGNGNHARLHWYVAIASH